jgi:hypothetical protein
MMINVVINSAAVASSELPVAPKFGPTLQPDAS